MIITRAAEKREKETISAKSLAETPFSDVEEEEKCGSIRDEILAGKVATAEKCGGAGGGGEYEGKNGF